MKPRHKTHAENQRVFAYGSNMDLSQMKERCPDSRLQPFVARLKGWRLCFPRYSEKRNGGVSSIVRDHQAVVWGVVYRITPRDLESLDQYEGLPTAYRRERIVVTARNGKRSGVWAYLAVPLESPPRNYAPSEEYLALYIRGAHHFNFPSTYIKKLKKIETAKRNR